MSLWQTMKTAATSIFANKMRSSLTMLGIVIGVCAVVLLVAIGQGFSTSMTTTFNNMGASALYVSSSRAKTVTVMRPLTMDDATALENKSLCPSISVVSPSIQSNVTVQYGNNSATVQASGITPVITQIKSYLIDQGRFITDQDGTNKLSVIVLGYQTAQDLFGTESPIDKYVRVAGSKFKVIGTLKESGGMGGDSYILMPLATMQARITGGTDLQQIAVKASTDKLVDTAITEITALLRARHYITNGASDDFQITDMRETLQSMQSTLSTFSLVMGAVGGISLVVGGIGIMNIMLVSVTERTREIGIRKAIGAKRRDILLQFLIEAGALSLTGGLIGLLFAIGGASLMGHMTLGSLSLKPEISGTTVLVAVGVSVAVGLLSGTYPAFNAARLDPIESLRHE